MPDPLRLDAGVVDGGCLFGGVALCWPDGGSWHRLRRATPRAGRGRSLAHRPLVWPAAGNGRQDRRRYAHGRRTTSDSLRVHAPRTVATPLGEIAVTSPSEYLIPFDADRDTGASDHLPASQKITTRKGRLKSSRPPGEVHDRNRPRAFAPAQRTTPARHPRWWRRAPLSTPAREPRPCA
jgi:hypothetical protein